MLFTINTKNNGLVQQMKYKSTPSSISPPMSTFAFSKTYTNYKMREIKNREDVIQPVGYANPAYDNTNSIQSAEQPKKKSMKWGEPTWFLFHTLAEKVKEESFSYIRNELLNNLYTICANLPCPDCANHAKAYMDGINFSTIRTKKDLKELFYKFHNVVNAKKNFPLFPRDKLEEKYSKAVTINIIQNFMEHFSDKHSSIHMISNDIHRARIVDYLKTWFNLNIHHFNM
jgi:hypothetical protein